jgi:hypothetical protein
MVALTAARTMARLSATLIVLTLSFTSFPARADSDYKKVCKIGADLKALAEDGNANSCRSLAIASNLQEYQLGCQSARDENLYVDRSHKYPSEVSAGDERVPQHECFEREQRYRGAGHLRKILGKSITVSEA